MEFFTKTNLPEDLIDSAKSVIENYVPQLPDVFLEEAQKARVAVPYCRTLEEKKEIGRFFLNRAATVSGMSVTPLMVSEFDRIINGKIN